MTKVEIYEMVNKTETPEELATVIRRIGALNEGQILGRARSFDAERMANFCLSVYEGTDSPRTITREYGLRQQLLYFMYHDGKLS